MTGVWNGRSWKLGPRILAGPIDPTPIVDRCYYTPMYTTIHYRARHITKAIWCANRHLRAGAVRPCSAAVPYRRPPLTATAGPGPSPAGQAAGRGRSRSRSGGPGRQRRCGRTPGRDAEGENGGRRQGDTNGGEPLDLVACSRRIASAVEGLSSESDEGTCQSHPGRAVETGRGEGGEEWRCRGDQVGDLVRSLLQGRQVVLVVAILHPRRGTMRRAMRSPVLQRHLAEATPAVQLPKVTQAPRYERVGATTRYCVRMRRSECEPGRYTKPWLDHIETGTERSGRHTTKGIDREDGPLRQPNACLLRPSTFCVLGRRGPQFHANSDR